MKKYFFFDIDGTLLTGVPGKQYIPPSALEALKLLQENGHFTAIATGRSYAMAKDVMESFGLSNMVSDGGNGITFNNRLIEVKPLDYGKCLALIDECIEKDYIWGFSPENTRERLVPDERFYDFTHDRYMKCTVVENLDPRNYSEIYKVYIACYEPEEYKLEALKDVPWCRYHREYLFVEPTDKSNGIVRMMQMLDAPLEDVVVFGDSLNDLSMFQDRWTSIAMGDGHESLKEKADYVTDSAAEDGIFNACRHFRWI